MTISSRYIIDIPTVHPNFTSDSYVNSIAIKTPYFLSKILFNLNYRILWNFGGIKP